MKKVVFAHPKSSTSSRLNLVFEDETQKFITTFPVFPNKWRFYMGPLAEMNESNIDKGDLSFNWFLCARPCLDKNNEKVIEVGKYSLFFDPSSGLSYYVKFDVNECVLKLVNGGIRFDFNKLDEKPDEKLSGIAMISNENSSEDCFKDLVCQSATLIFRKSVLEISMKCPYIDFAKSHYKFLKKHIHSFPSNNFVMNAKPGKDSLYLRSLIRPYLLE